MSIKTIITRLKRSVSVAAVVLLTMSSAAYAADWPSYLYDNSHSSNQSGESTLTTSNISSISQLWTFKAGANFASQPIVVGHVVYVGSWDGYEYALDDVTGALLWKTYLGIGDYTNCTNGQPEKAGVYSSANVQGGHVYVSGGDSYWYDLSTTDGHVEGKVFTGDSTNSGGNYNWASTITDTISSVNYAFVGVSSNCDDPLVPGKILKINLSDYSVAGTFRTVPEDYSAGGGVWTSPVLDTSTSPHTLFFTTGTPSDLANQPYTQAMVALNDSTMAETDVWQVPSSEYTGLGLNDADWGTSPVLYTKNGSGTKVAAAIHKDGYVYALDRTNLAGSYLWRTRIAKAGDSPVAGDGSASTPAYGNDSATGSNALYVAGGNTYTSETMCGSSLTANGTVEALNPDTGACLWATSESDPVIPALTYTNGMVLAVAGTKLDILNSATGASLKTETLPSAGYSPPSISDGRIFIGAGDGTLEVYGVSSGNTGCPSVWTCADINTGTQTGSQTFTNGSVAVVAGGGDISSTADQFRFVYGSTTGDADISAHVASQTNTNGYAKAGVMLRTGTGSGSPYFGVFVTPSNDMQIQYRSTSGGSTNVYGTGITGDYYVRIKRVNGGTYMPMYSSDGVTWTPFSGHSYTLTGDMATTSTMLAGLADTSHNTGSLSTATFDTINLTSVPSACPTDWSCSDIGSPGLTGGQFKNNFDGPLTVWGGGTDIAGTSDQFHYVYQPTTGNADLAVQITSQANSYEYAKAGVMFRADTTANAPYYAALVTPSHGLLIQYRSTSGATNSSGPTTAGVAAPLYVRVGRSGASMDTFTTYTSSDGVTWTAVTSSNVDIPALGGTTTTIDAGYAVASHSSGTLGEASFTDVSLGCHVDWTCEGINETILQAGISDNPTSNLNNWQVQGSGDDIWSTADNFQFDHQSLTGDGGISARLTDQSDTNEYAKAGVMIRDSNAANAPFYDIVALKSHDFEVQYRLTAGATAQTVYSGINTTYPYYLKVVRTGTSYTGYTSTDGTTWTAVSGSTKTINASDLRSSGALVGLAVGSHDSYKVETAHMDNVNVFTVNSCKTSWTCEDISNNGAIGLLTSYDATNDIWTTQGSGSDIWGTTDHFHYNFISFTGDGGISSRVYSQGNTDGYAKAGVMIRDSDDPSAAFYDIVLTPSNGILVQYRTTSGGSASSVSSGISTSYPYYVKVSRTGTSYTAYTSTDGSTWTAVSGSTVTIASGDLRSTGALRGNATTSHTTTTASTAVFDNNVLY